MPADAPASLLCAAHVVGAAALLSSCVAETDASVLREPAATRAAAGRAAEPAARPTTSSAGQNGGLIPITPTAPGSVGPGLNGCDPGHYVGTFEGVYNSAAWGNGILPLLVEATPSLGRPGLEFWLEQTAVDCAPGVEFCADFTVKGGKIRGFANPFSDGDSQDDPRVLVAVPFEIDFGGDLDCARGQFRGLLQNGCYDVATFLFRFEGTAPAAYDQATSSFTEGEWVVKEKAMPDSLLPPDPSIGGMGSWTASLTQDGAMPAATTAGLCQQP